MFWGHAILSPSCDAICMKFSAHYIDVIMTTMGSQITSLTVVYSTVYSDADQRKHQSSAPLAFVWGIHRDRWIPRTKGQLRGKCFHLMTSSCYRKLASVACEDAFVWIESQKNKHVTYGKNTNHSNAIKQFSSIYVYHTPILQNKREYTVFHIFISITRFRFQHIITVCGKTCLVDLLIRSIFRVKNCTSASARVQFF